MQPWVIAGLGNPGPDYAQTRHNIGFQLVDALGGLLGPSSWKSEGCVLSCKLQWEGTPLFLVKPQTYMNRSGTALRPFCDYYRIDSDRLVVVHDDCGLDIGRMKLSQGGGAGGHHGVEDVMRHLGEGVCRFRIGIGAKPYPDMRLEDFVLGRFTVDEWSNLSSLFPKFSGALCSVVSYGIMRAMNQINRKDNENSNS